MRRRHYDILVGRRSEVPPPSGSIPTTLQSSVERHGITWEFDGNYPVGEYVNGDPFVVGPVTVTSIDPPFIPNATTLAGTEAINGSQIDTPTQTQAFHSNSTRWSPALEVGGSLPLTIVPNGKPKSLVSTRGATNQSSQFHSGSGQFRPSLIDAAVLTIVEEFPQVGSFRPAYIRGDKRQHNTSEIKWDRIDVRLSPMQFGVHGPFSLSPNNRLWLNPIGETWRGSHLAAINNNGNNYGQAVARTYNANTLTLLCDFSLAQKEALAIECVQIGIDYFACFEDGGHWAPNTTGTGGHFSGRKWPCLFAGIMLDDTPMMQMPVNYHCKTGEDFQPYWHDGTDSTVPHPIGRAAWTANFCNTGIQDGQWNNTYRRCCTTNSWSGSALAMWVMKQHTDVDPVSLWNHDPYFDLIDDFILEERDPSLGSGWADPVWAGHMFLEHRDKIAQGVVETMED